MRALKIRLHEGTYRSLADQADMQGTTLAALIRDRLETPAEASIERESDPAILQKIDQLSIQLNAAIKAQSEIKPTPVQQDCALIEKLERLERLLKSRASREESIAILEALIPFHQDQSWRAKLTQIAQAIADGKRPPLMTQPTK